MKNGHNSPRQKAQQILSYAVSTPHAKVIGLAKQLSKDAPSPVWYEQVDKLRKFLVREGLAPDTVLWTTALRPPPVTSYVRSAMASLGASDNGGSIDSILKVIGLVAVIGAVGWIAYKYVVKDEANTLRYASYERVPGILGSQRGYSD